MGTVIGIFSAKGGVGKTLLATNLAVAFGAGYHRKTILIDLNKGNGTADLLLDLVPDRSWSDLVSVLHELTPRHISLTVTEYRQDVDLLASPPEIFMTEVFKMEELSLLLDAITKEYDLVVLDMPSGNASPVSESFALSDIQLILLTPVVLSLRSTSHFASAQQDKGMLTGLVINQHSPGAAINPDEIKDHLGKPILGVLTIDQAGVWANISYGEPCVLRKYSKLGRSIRQLSARLLRLIDQGKIKKPYQELED